MGDPIRVAIVDDNERCRQAVRGWFDGVSDVLIVGEAQGGPETPRWLREVCPDVVLMDVSAAETERVRQVAACAEVLVLHVAGQEALVLEALRAGALGHLDMHSVRPAQAIAAVRAVNRGEAVLSPGLAGQIVDQLAQFSAGRNKSMPRLG